jgi:predicted small integral membrane protein
MKVAKIIALLGVLAMTTVLIYAFTVGDFNAEGSRLLSMPWGIVSLVDLYVGFILFSGWIVYRERSLARSAIWVVLMMVLGFFTASLYTFIALQTSGGDWRRFWMGKRWETG